MNSNNDRIKNFSETIAGSRCDHLAVLGLVLLGVSAPLQMATAADQGQQISMPPANTPRLHFGKTSIQNGAQLLAQSGASQQDLLNAFSRSKYSYFDAAVLAKFWRQDLGGAKARIGSKLLAGPLGQAILDQFLVDARIQALGAVNSNQGLTYWQDSSQTYDDAVALAKFWGEASPWDAKVRVERNLILGNEAIVKNALSLAKENAPPKSR